MFTKSTKTVPADETAKNAKLLIQAGYIHKEMAGVYGYLPLGLMVLENIKQIVRQEMASLGAQEIIMTSLQRQELWQRTDRWEDSQVDVWFKTALKNGTSLGLGWSHEEPISDMVKTYIKSYRDLPVNVYQFQTKLRNELRAKSGIMRGREFVMKDLYSFSKSEAEHQQFYDSVSEAYLKIFQRVGLGDVTFKTFASGGAFTKFSHEFQTLVETGEDTIYLSRDKKIAVNKEVLSDDVLEQLDLNRNELEEVRAAEVGNIFSFGGVKSQQLGLYFSDESGQEQTVILGSYGIGISRLMGVVVEHFADTKGLIWPASIAPAQVYLVRLGSNPAVTRAADNLYQSLTAKNISVLYDDRELRPGEKFADADLLGIPKRVVVSDQTVAQDQYEVKDRLDNETRLVSQIELFKLISKQD